MITSMEFLATTGSGRIMPHLYTTKITALIMMSLAMSGCGTVDRLATTASVIPDTVEQLHPIVLADAPHVIDLFPANGRLDESDKGRIQDYADLFKERGRGPITIVLPQGTGAGRQENVVNAIRSQLSRAGLSGHVRVAYYQITNPSLASAVRLSFVGLKAKVATQCGEWPDDMASASSLHTWQNKPYWNMGCAYQNMLAVQIANPRDIATPRGEQPADVRMRMRAIQKVRAGNDPGTNWKVQNSNIGSVGGN